MIAGDCEPGNWGSLQLSAVQGGRFGEFSSFLDLNFCQNFESSFLDLNYCLF